jgi:HlyD family secretion protein
VQIPASALFRQGTGWAVFTVSGGRATARPVQVGHRGALDVEILGGLAPDEVVVIHPGASVHEGAKIVSR